jgi:hypothetical protein
MIVKAVATGHLLMCLGLNELERDRDESDADTARVRLVARNMRQVARQAAMLRTLAAAAGVESAAAGVRSLYRNGAPAWMKLITTFPLGRYDITAVNPQMLPWASEARQYRYEPAVGINRACRQLSSRP